MTKVIVFIKINVFICMINQNYKTMIYTKTLRISPIMALEMMELNVSNRPLNKVTVDYYARQMKSGQWTLSGQTISISDKNTLIDGQHRLAAVVKSGCTIEFIVAYDVPEGSFINYDSLRSRGLSDVMSCSRIPNAKKTSSAISKYNAIRIDCLAAAGFGFTSGRGDSGGVKKDRKLTNVDAMDLYYSNSELWDYLIRLSEKCYSRIKLYTQSQIAAISFYLIKDIGHNREVVESFFLQLFLNENVTNKSIYNLREKLITSSIGNLRLINRLKYVYLVKCWNAFVTGREIKIYSFTEGEKIPSFL